MSAYYNDNDAYCCRVLRKNIAAGHLPPGDDRLPPVGRMAHGLPHRVDRLRGLGNAVVPQAAAVALRVIAAMEAEAGHE